MHNWFIWSEYVNFVMGSKYFSHVLMISRYVLILDLFVVLHETIHDQCSFPTTFFIPFLANGNFKN